MIRRLLNLRGVIRLSLRLLRFAMIKSNDEDFWAWLFLRATDPSSKDYEDKDVTYFLISSAIRLQEPYRACRIFERFGPMVSNRLTYDEFGQLGRLAGTIGNAKVRDESLKMRNATAL